MWGRPILQGDQRGSRQNQPLPKPLISSQAGQAGEAGTGQAAPPHWAPDPASAGRGRTREDAVAAGPFPSRHSPLHFYPVRFPFKHMVSFATPKSALRAAAKPDHLSVPLSQMNESEPTKEPLSGYQGLGHTNLQTKRGKKPQQTEEVGAGGARPPIFPLYQEPYPSMDEVPLACNPPPETSSGVQLSTGRPRAVCGRWDTGEGRTTWFSKATASPGTSRLGSAPLPAKAPLLRERRGRDGTGTSTASPLPHAAADC